MYNQSNAFFLTSLILIITCSFVSCHEIGDGYGDAFSCKINGEKWTPKVDNSDNIFDALSSDPIRIKYYKTTGLLSVSASRERSSSVGQQIRFSVILNPEEVLHQINTAGTLSPLRAFPCLEYRIDSTTVAQFELTHFDTLTRKIKGEFEFVALGKEGCSDKIEITEGKIDTYYIF